MFGHALMEGVVDYYVPVGHACYLRHFMAYEHYGRRGSHVGDNAVEMLLEMFVEIAQRLVEHQNGRCAHYGTRKEGALKLTSRKISDRPVLQGRHLYFFECGIDAFAFFGWGEGGVGQQGRFDHFAYRNREM